MTKLVITEDGNCTWAAPVTLNSQCRIDVARFPFDEQTCHVAIGSWTYSGYKINITYSERTVAMNDYIRNGEWDVKSAILSHNFRYYLPDNIPYPDVTLTLKIKRRSLYYGLQLILPLVVISTLTFFSFILPLKSEGQISIVISLVLTISVFSIIISSALPESSDTSSVLQKYCIGIFLSVAMVSFPAALTTRFVNLSYPMPNWLRKCMEGAAKILCVNSEVFAQISNEMGVDHNIEVDGHKLEVKPADKSQESADSIDSEEIQNRQQGGIDHNIEVDGLELKVTSPDENHENVNKTQKHKEQWKTAAKVIHRIFLVFFFLCFVGFNSFLLIEYGK